MHIYNYLVVYLKVYILKINADKLQHTINTLYWIQVLQINRHINNRIKTNFTFILLIHWWLIQCVCVYIYMYIYLYICVYVCVYVCIHIHMYIYIYIYIYTYIYIYYMYICVCICMHICICLHIYIYKSICPFYLLWWRVYDFKIYNGATNSPWVS